MSNTSAANAPQSLLRLATPTPSSHDSVLYAFLLVACYPQCTLLSPATCTSRKLANNPLDDLDPSRIERFTYMSTRREQSSTREQELFAGPIWHRV